LKAKQARQREQKNASAYRHAGNAVYRAPHSITTTTHEYLQIHGTRLDALHPFESSPAQQHHQPHPMNANSSRPRYETPTGRAWGEVPQDWRGASPAHMALPPTRWSPDNYHDLHSRHPSFAKNLLSQANVREPTLSPRELDLAFHDDRYDSIGHGNYIQGPNGGAPDPRDPYHHYGRKEF